MKDTLSDFSLLRRAVRGVLFGAREKAESPAYDPQLPLAENFRLQLEWVTGAAVKLKTHGRDAFIFDLRKPACHIARVPIKGDADARIVMAKEKDFSDWVRQEFPDDLNRFALVENNYKIFVGDPHERDVHEEFESNKGNLTQNLELLSGFSPKNMAAVWLRILKPVVLVYGKRQLVHGDVKPDNVLVDLTPEGDYTFRMADWGGHYDPANPRPPYEGTPMFQTKETLLSGTLRPGDDVRALKLSFIEIYAGDCLTGIAEAYPKAFELIPFNGKDVSHLKYIPDVLSDKIPGPLLKLLNSPFEDVLDFVRALTQVYMGLEH